MILVILANSSCFHWYRHNVCPFPTPTTSRKQFPFEYVIGDTIEPNRDVSQGGWIGSPGDDCDTAGPESRAATPKPGQHGTGSGRGGKGANDAASGFAKRCVETETRANRPILVAPGVPRPARCTRLTWRRTRFNIFWRLK